MPFCKKCGQKLDDNSNQCLSCGPDISDTKKPDANIEQAKTYLTISAIGISLLALFSLVRRDAIGVVLTVGIAATVYLLGIKKIEEGNFQIAEQSSLIAGIVGATVGLLVLLGGSAIGVLDIAIMVPIFLAWNILKQK